MSNSWYHKLRREPLYFDVDETDINYSGEGLLTKDESKTEKKGTFYNCKKKKVFRYATLVAIQNGERPLTLAFLSVLPGQKRKDTVATLLKFVQGLKPYLILLDGGFAEL